MFTSANLMDMGLAAVYSLGGLAMFIVSFCVVDKLSPGNLWKEIIEEHNTAVAVLMGCCAIGLAIVIAAAIHAT